MNTVHQTIAEKAGDAMNMGQPYLAIFKQYSIKPDQEDQYWDRLYKHVYDPIYNWGGAPDACKEKVDSAIYYAVWGGDLEMAYQELGRASHYLIDVGNPYHSSLWPTDKIRHDIPPENIDQVKANNAGSCEKDRRIRERAHRVLQ